MSVPKNSHSTSPRSAGLSISHLVCDLVRTTSFFLFGEGVAFTEYTQNLFHTQPGQGRTPTLHGLGWGRSDAISRPILEWWHYAWHCPRLVRWLVRLLSSISRDTNQKFGRAVQRRSPIAPRLSCLPSLKDSIQL